VLDEQGQTIPSLDPRDIRALVRAGTASAGMVAKLTACEAAVRAGVKDVVIVDGRDARQLARWLDGAGRNAPTASGTRVRR
jgi:acetylglutamate kinase